MQTFNQLFFKKKQIFSYFFKEISDFSGCSRCCFKLHLQGVVELMLTDNEKPSKSERICSGIHALSARYDSKMNGYPPEYGSGTACSLPLRVK